MLRIFAFSAWALILVLSANAASVPNAEDVEVSVADTVYFHLYNDISQHGSHEAGRQLFTNEVGTLDDTGINPAKPLVVLVHGFIQTHKCGFPQDIKDAYLNLHEGISVVTVNWGAHSCSSVSEAAQLLCYPTAAAKVDSIGQAISNFITALVKKGLATPGNVHIVGASMGAHVSGEAGNRFLKANGIKVSRITALDPGGPAFTCGGARCLSKNDADFVDVIHTDMGVLGTTQALGHIDFYPNGGGHPQPTCEGLDDKCSHATCAQYWLHSIGRSDIVATKCGSYDDFKNGACSNGETTVFGEKAIPGQNGAFYLSVVPGPFSGRYSCYAGAA